MPSTSPTQSPPAVATVPAPSQDRLAVNLRAIATRRPDLAAKIADTPADPSVTFSLAPDGTLTATRNDRALASKRRPREEAARVAESIDIKEHAVLVTLGFALGHHVRAVAEKLGKAGLLCVFEPDLPLLRAVLERIDHSPWIEKTNLVLFDNPDDSAAISRAAYGSEAIFALGVRFIEHGPSAVRLADSTATFSASFARTVAALRTSVITTLVQTQITIRNGLMNAEHYAARAGAGDEGIADLENLCAARPAIVVSAGPSLRTNIHLLKDPAVRDKCVIICVQTALKTLLAEGITPHFVTALDYHEISKRFYEGLTEDDVKDITLVAEGKVNPAVLDTYPGPVRMPADETLELILPRDTIGHHATIRAGSTVAHLCYYLARHLGCDPVILTGQDLAFTDGLYYGQGAAIHTTWAPELGPFRTLEMLEWERIARNRSSLRAVKDHAGTPVYTDEQMATYLTQFERMFAEDADRNLTTIDASEGGAHKNNTQAMPLAEALKHYAGPSAPTLPEIPIPPRTPLSTSHKTTLRNQLSTIRKQTGRLTTICEKSEHLLTRMKDAADDQARIGKLIDEIHALRNETSSLRPAYDLVQKINQTGAFNRVRADRDINLSDLSPVERQQRQIDRDITNVRWLRDAATEVATLLDAADAALAGEPKITANPPATPAEPKAPTSAAAVLFIDHELDTNANPRTLSAQTLLTTLNNLAACSSITEAILLSADPAATRALLTSAPQSLTITHAQIDLAPLRDIRRAVASARAWSPNAWRGAIAGTTIYDALFDPETLSRIMHEHNLDTALLLADDWTNLRPDLTDAIITRRNEDPDRHRVVFTQAAPGLAPIALSRHLVDEFANASDTARPWSTIGGMLGYMPFNPLADPITKALCVTADPALRDAALTTEPRNTPSHIIIDLTRQRTTPAGQRNTWFPQQSHAKPLSADEWINHLNTLAEAFPGASITFAGTGDPLQHPDALKIIRAARNAPFRFIHVRTDPLNTIENLTALTELADVISLDLLAHTAETHHLLTGSEDFERAVTNTQALLDARTETARRKLPWIVPRITRCEAAAQDIEPFYDRWLLAAGSAVIDPLPRTIPTDRFTPLTPPTLAHQHTQSYTLALRADASAVTACTDHALGKPVASLRNLTPADAWNAVIQARKTD